MSRQATRGMSAPPEVVFSTATDPDRRGAWLPGEFGVAPVHTDGDVLEVRLTAGSSAAGVLRVNPGASGGSTVELSLPDDGAAPDVVLGDLDRAVGDNFNAG